MLPNFGGAKVVGHSAAFPVGLPAFFIKAFSEDVANVYEPFCGSGTTLVAAEQLGRKCYGMEISPAYCDVIIKRWETLTGKKATLSK
jgi:DNA modification methylase